MSAPAPALEERPSLAATLLAAARRWAGRAGEAAAWIAVTVVALGFLGAVITPGLRPLAAGLVLLVVGYAAGRLHGEFRMSERVHYLAAENAALKRANYMAATEIAEMRGER